MSRFARPRVPRSMPSTRPRWRPAGVTTAHQGCDRTITRTTTGPSCWTPTVTMSKSCATIRSNGWQGGLTAHSSYCDPIRWAVDSAVREYLDTRHAHAVWIALDQANDDRGDAWLLEMRPEHVSVALAGGVTMPQHRIYRVHGKCCIARRRQWRHLGNRTWRSSGDRIGEDRRTDSRPRLADTRRQGRLTARWRRRRQRPAGPCGFRWE